MVSWKRCQLEVSFPNEYQGHWSFLVAIGLCQGRKDCHAEKANVMSNHQTAMHSTYTTSWHTVAIACPYGPLGERMRQSHWTEWMRAHFFRDYQRLTFGIPCEVFYRNNCSCPRHVVFMRSIAHHMPSESTHATWSLYSEWAARLVEVPEMESLPSLSESASSACWAITQSRRTLAWPSAPMI